jgi:hypothetical protein
MVLELQQQALPNLWHLLISKQLCSGHVQMLQQTWWPASFPRNTQSDSRNLTATTATSSTGAIDAQLAPLALAP